MKNLIIEGTKKTPSILTNHETGTLEISGRSSPENSAIFYESLMKWIDSYLKNPKEETVINIRLDHFNTGSSKCFLDIFKKFETLLKDEKEVIINWYYESTDSAMMEAGESYKYMLNIPFRILKY